jgi:hypothetical protein
MLVIKAIKSFYEPKFKVICDKNSKSSAFADKHAKRKKHILFLIRSFGGIHGFME